MLEGHILVGPNGLESARSLKRMMHFALSSLGSNDWVSCYKGDGKFTWNNDTGYQGSHRTYSQLVPLAR